MFIYIRCRRMPSDIKKINNIQNILQSCEATMIRERFFFSVNAQYTGYIVNRLV